MALSFRSEKDWTLSELFCSGPCLECSGVRQINTGTSVMEPLETFKTDKDLRV